MTLLVRITHATTGYSKTAVVQAINPETGQSSGERRVVHDGESTELYVHSGQALKITEGEPVVTETTNEVQGARVTKVSQEEIDRVQGVKTVDAGSGQVLSGGVTSDQPLGAGIDTTER